MKSASDLHDALAEASLQYMPDDVLEGLVNQFGLSRAEVRQYLHDLAREGRRVQLPFGPRPEEPAQTNAAPVKKPPFVVAEEEDFDEPPSPDIIAANRASYFEKSYQEFCGLIERPFSRPLPRPARSNVGLTRRKVAVMSDLHGNPCGRAVAKLVAEKPDLALLVGDVFDQQAVSRFDKDYVIPIEQEIAAIRAFAEILSPICPSRWAKGNHDTRMWKYFVQRVEPQYMHLVNTNMFELTLAKLPNCEVVDNTHRFRTSLGGVQDAILKTSFLIFEGDAVFGHAEVARKHELTTARALREWYNLWRPALGWPEAAVVGQAHTHRAAVGYPAGGHRVDLDLGCMLDPSMIQYAMDGSTKFSPPTIGFTILEQDATDAGWRTDLSSIRFVLA